MQVGDEVELRGDRQVNNTVVKAVNQAERTVKVLDSNEWLSLHDMFSLACFGTHDRSPEWAKVDNEGFKEPTIPPPPTQRVLLHPSLADATDDETSVKQVRVCVRASQQSCCSGYPHRALGGFRNSPSVAIRLMVSTPHSLPPNPMPPPLRSCSSRLPGNAGRTMRSALSCSGRHHPAPRLPV